MQKTFYTYQRVVDGDVTSAQVEDERPDLVSAGWTLIGTQDIEVEVPQTLTARQLRLVLVAAGLYDSIDAAMATRPSSDPARIEWEYATEFDIDSPLLVSTAAALGITETQIEQMYIDGAKL